MRVKVVQVRGCEGHPHAHKQLCQGWVVGCKVRRCLALVGANAAGGKGEEDLAEVWVSCAGVSKGLRHVNPWIMK